MSAIKVGNTSRRYIPVEYGFVNLKVSDYEVLENEYPETDKEFPVGFSNSHVKDSK